MLENHSPESIIMSDSKTWVFNFLFFILQNGRQSGAVEKVLICSESKTWLRVLISYGTSLRNFLHVRIRGVNVIIYEKGLMNVLKKRCQQMVILFATSKFSSNMTLHAHCEDPFQAEKQLLFLSVSPLHREFFWDYFVLLVTHGF